MRKLLPILILTVFSFLSAIKVQAQCIPVTSCTFPDIITNVTFAGINITQYAMRLVEVAIAIGPVLPELLYRGRLILYQSQPEVT